MFWILLSLCLIQPKDYLTPYEVATYRYERLSWAVKNRTPRPEFLKLEAYKSYYGDVVNVTIYTNFSQDNLQFHIVHNNEVEADIYEVVGMFLQIEFGQPCKVEINGFD